MKRNAFIIAIVVLVVLIVAGLMGLQQINASAATTAVRLQTATAQRGTLVATVSAAGNVSAPNQADMAFQTSGTVAQVPVQVGDAIKKGQLLMGLDTTDLQLALKTAQTNLASAQANYDSQQATLQFAVKTAQANLASAQANYDSTVSKNGTNRDQLLVAKAAIDNAAAALQQAQAAYDTVAWRSDVATTSQAATLQTATSNYTSAVATYNITAAGINDTALRTAQASVDSAQVAVDQAQKNLDTSMRTAQATLDNAQLAVQQAQRNLDNATISAPFDGIVSAVNYSAGDSAGTGTAGTSTAVSIADLINLQVKVVVAEVDVAQIAVGDAVTLTLDALPGQTYQAQVINIGPVGTVTSGVVNYPVTVAVSNAGGGVKPGMTANLSVIVAQHQNVLTIPLRAVRTQGNQKIVTVLFKGQQIPMPVGTGLQNDTSVEITNGLLEGDVVVLNQTTTRQPNAGGFGVPGLGGLGR